MGRKWSRIMIEGYGYITLINRLEDQADELLKMVKDGRYDNPEVAMKAARKIRAARGILMEDYLDYTERKEQGVHTASN